MDAGILGAREDEIGCGVDDEGSNGLEMGGSSGNLATTTGLE